jgi:hypothetical protein
MAPVSEGSTLVASNAVDYGLGADFKIVANTGNTLVAQSASTGLVDFLTIGAGGKLVASALSTVPVTKIFGIQPIPALLVRNSPMARSTC